MVRKTGNIPFEYLQKVLLDLGFEESLIPGPHPYRFFKHPPSDTILVYRNYQPGEPVSWADHVKSRQFLDEQGLLEADEFEDLMATKTDDIPFSRLRQILLALGFTEKVIPGRHTYRYFSHEPTDSVAVYRNYRLDESISWADHATTRRLLNERGLLEAEDFESLLHEGSGRVSRE